MYKSKMEREIHGLDYTISKIMVFLDMMFFGQKGWIPCCNGLNIKMRRNFRKNYRTRAVAEIYPVGWPKGSCVCIELFGDIRPNEERHSSWMVEDIAIYGFASLMLKLENQLYPDIRSSQSPSEQLVIENRARLLENMRKILST